MGDFRRFHRSVRSVGGLAPLILEKMNPRTFSAVMNTLIDHVPIDLRQRNVLGTPMTVRTYAKTAVRKNVLVGHKLISLFWFFTPRINKLPVTIYSALDSHRRFKLTTITNVAMQTEQITLYSCEVSPSTTL